MNVRYCLFFPGDCDLSHPSVRGETGLFQVCAGCRYGESVRLFGGPDTYRNAYIRHIEKTRKDSVYKKATKTLSKIQKEDKDRSKPSTGLTDAGGDNETSEYL